MEFAGNEYIYLPKQKKEKIKKLRKSEEDNKGDAPPMSIEKEENIPSKQEEKKENEIDSEDSDDAYLSVDSNNFNIDLEKSQQNNMQMNFMPAPGIKFKKAIDTNVCVIRYETLESKPDKVVNELYKCQKCNAYLNKYSTIIPAEEKDKFNWTCEFCFNENKNIQISKENILETECFEKCIKESQTINGENKEEDNSSLIFCLDQSGSMDANYYIDKKLSSKFNEIKGEKIGDSITRLQMIKLSVEKIIKTLLEKSPKVKVGLVTFADDIIVKGDCLSNIITVKGKNLNNESFLQSLGKENTNLIKTEIDKSSENIIKALREIKTTGCTAMGPAIFLSLHLLNNAKIGSRIFLCTDGESNEGIGNLYRQKEAIEFYTKVGKIAKEKGIVISLIAFEDSESQINILKNMIEQSGGDIFRVNPEFILDEVNDFLENKALASDVEIRMNLNKSMTFRDEDKKEMTNEGSTIIKKIGNVTREKETYFELKFKSAIKLSELNNINFDELKDLIFQIIFNYKNKDEGEYTRIITKKLKISDNKEEIQKQANLNIVSTLQIQKSAKLASVGKLMDAQAQIHIARNFLNNNIRFNNNNMQIFNQFNSNMNSFHSNLQSMNMMPQMNNNMGFKQVMINGNMINNVMPMNPNNHYFLNNMNNMNNMPMNNMNMMNNMNNMYNNPMNNMNRMNNMNNMYNMPMNNMNNMAMNNMNMMNNMNNMNINMNMMNNMNSMPLGMNNMMNNNMNMNMNSDLLSGQIYSLSNTSERRQNATFQRLNKK